MLILVTYDVSVESQEGKRRLRHVAKTCKNYGVRVQNSVFECVVDTVQFQELKHKLGIIIDHKTDSLRYYNLGNAGRKKVDHVGAKPGVDVEGVLII